MTIESVKDVVESCLFVQLTRVVRGGMCSDKGKTHT